MTKWDPRTAAEWSEVPSLLSDVLEWSFSGWTLRVIASLDQRIDYQVKCDRSILFGATKREVVVKTKTKATTAAAVAAKYIENKAQRDEAEPFPRSQAESILKTEILSLTEHLQRNPTYEEGQGRPLPAQGAPLANLTTVKLNRKKVRKL